MEARDGAAMERYIKFYYKGENSKVKSCLHEGEYVKSSVSQLQKGKLIQ